MGEVARAVITMWFSVLVMCSTQKPGRSGNKAIGDMDVDSFLHMGYVGEDCLLFIIPHPLAQEMRESHSALDVYRSPRRYLSKHFLVSHAQETVIRR